MKKHFKTILIGGIIIALALWRFLASDGSGGTGEALAEVKVPELTAAETAGKAVFDNNCAACHGDNAAGKDGFAPPLVHRIYEPNHHADVAFQRAAQLGVRAHHWTFGNMPPVEGVSEEDVSQILTYVRALQRANGIN
uniref:c-type cytochrome n=1 Tax=Pararhizobium sp. IMCC3301 TaxID=3067904 RepID=UPI002740723E|nr:cytochrome c [Pararhizobium sp. IMCC3301]